MSQPKMSLVEAQQTIETLTAPRVSKTSIEAQIDRVEYARPFESHRGMTLCAIRMKNGFVAVGKSAPASPENFDPDVGERYAYEDAFKQLWAFEAYVLLERLSGNVRS